MNCLLFKEGFLAVIKENDPYRGAKHYEVEKWYNVFVKLIRTASHKRVPFFLDVLSDEECWEKTDTIHGIKLNRRIAAKKMIEPRSWRGWNNPLDNLERYKIACWCCLEEDILALFELLRQDETVIDFTDKNIKREEFLELLRRTLEDENVVKVVRDQKMMEYWLHILGGSVSKLELEGKHLYEYGIDLALDAHYVEAVEFFWTKIKSVSEDELSAQQKEEIFMRTAVRAAGRTCAGHPEIFGFFFSQTSPDKYLELLHRDLSQNGEYGTLSVLHFTLSFDQFQNLFDYAHPSNISEGQYYSWLKFAGRGCRDGYYANASIRLFMHMWMKDGFNSHRSLVLNNEIKNVEPFSDGLLMPFIDGYYLEPVWAVLDKATLLQLDEFMTSPQADYICSVFQSRGDQHAFTKFVAYDVFMQRS